MKNIDIGMEILDEKNDFRIVKIISPHFEHSFSCKIGMFDENDNLQWSKENVIFSKNELETMLVHAG